MRLRTTMTWLTLLCVAMLVSCGRDDTMGPGDGTALFPRTTPEELIRCFAHAMEERDMDSFAECHDEAYLFEFTLQDAELIGLPVGEPWWGRTEDLAAMDNLFESGQVSGIECDLHVSSGPWPDGDLVRYRLEPNIKITVEDGSWSERMTYWVFSSWFDVEIGSDPEESEKWVLLRIKESLKDPSGSGAESLTAAGTEPSTFGGIKSMFK